MRTNITPEVATFLNNLCTLGVGGQYGVIDLYTFTLLSGPILKLSSHPMPVTWNGNTYLGSGPYVTRSKIRQVLKLEVSQVSITLHASPIMTVAGLPILTAIEQGLFAGALVEIDRLFLRSLNPFVPVGTVIWFVGQLAELEELGRSHAKISAKDPTALLGTQHPRNLFLTGCRHTLFDVGCGVFKTDSVLGQQTGVVQSGSTPTVIKTDLTQIGTLSGPSTPPALSSTVSDPSFTMHSNLPAATYFVVITFTVAEGETLPGPEASLAVTSGGAYGTTSKLLQVASPTSYPAGATGWNLYIGLAPGDEQLQAPNIPFGSPWRQTGNILLFQGVPPPTQSSSGWFTQGAITFTTGALTGITQGISQYDNPGGAAGIITTLPPLPSAPAPGDRFTVLPGCDRTAAVCGTKFNNLIHFSGFPYIPSPETSV